MKRTILRSAAVLGTVGFAGFLLAACSNNSSGSSEASKEINVYVDKGYLMLKKLQKLLKKKMA